MTVQPQHQAINERPPAKIYLLILLQFFHPLESSASHSPQISRANPLVTFYQPHLQNFPLSPLRTHSHALRQWKYWEHCQNFSQTLRRCVSSFASFCPNRRCCCSLRDSRL